MAKKSFKSLIQAGDKPVLVDFYADWCGPCQTMSPVVQEVSRDLSGAVKVIKVNVDKNQAAASQFGVRSIPTFMLFHRGKVLWRGAGYMPKRELSAKIKGAIAKG